MNWKRTGEYWEQRHMLFGLYAPVPHVTVGSHEIARATLEAAAALAPRQLDGQYELSRDVLTAADRAGFDIALFAERHLGTDLEAWMLGSAIGSMLLQMRAMVAVHPGLWSPQLVAKMAVSLDRIVPGRMAINLVTGWNVEEHRMYGGDAMVENDDRYVRAEEFITIVKGMFAATPYSFKGRFYDVEAARLLLRPASTTPPEIFTASRSQRGLDMVARVADWWFLDFDKAASTTTEIEDSLKRSIEGMRSRMDRLGRRVRFAYNPFIAFGETREAAIAEARRLLVPTEPHADLRKLESRIAPAMMGGCVGHPEEVRRQIERYASMGIELLLFKFPPTVHRVEEIRQEVIEPLRGVDLKGEAAA